MVSAIAIYEGYNSLAEKLLREGSDRSIALICPDSYSKSTVDIELMVFLVNDQRNKFPNKSAAQKRLRFSNPY